MRITWARYRRGSRSSSIVCRKNRYVNEPGTRYLYSNFGYATLGLAIERAGTQPFMDQVDTGILAPLGMARSAMEATPLVRENLAYGYHRAPDGPASRADGGRELDGRGYRVPSGALFSTITDLAKFAAWEMGAGPAGILNKETQDANYGRAFFYIQTAGRGGAARAGRLRGDPGRGGPLGPVTTDRPRPSSRGCSAPTPRPEHDYDTWLVLADLPGADLPDTSPVAADVRDPPSPPLRPHRPVRP